jgi:hypothetical protein
MNYGAANYAVLLRNTTGRLNLKYRSEAWNKNSLEAAQMSSVEAAWSYTKIDQQINTDIRDIIKCFNSYQQN